MDSAQCACRAARVPPARSHLHTARQAVLRLSLAHRSVCSALAGGISPRQTGRAARRACLGPYAPSARPHLCLVARERMLTRPTSLTRASARCARQAARAPQAPWRRHPARLGRSPLRLARRSVHPAHQVTSSERLNPTHPTIISHPIPSHPTPSHPISSHPIPPHPTLPHPIPSHPIICQPTLPPPGTYQKQSGTTSCEICSRGNYVRLTTRPPPPTLTPTPPHPCSTPSQSQPTPQIPHPTTTPSSPSPQRSALRGARLPSPASPAPTGTLRAWLPSGTACPSALDSGVRWGVTFQ